MTSCTPSTALIELFEHASKTLPADKLEWLGNLSDHAQYEAKNLSSTLEALAISVDSVTPWLSYEELRSIFFGLSNQAGLVSTMIKISSDAQSIAKDRLRVDA